jgi:hypothetical protein
MIMTQNPGSKPAFDWSKLFHLIGQVSFCPWDFAIGNGAATALLGIVVASTPEHSSRARQQGHDTR